MACIRALCMIEYQVINRLIFQPKHNVVGTQKNRRKEKILLSIKLQFKSDESNKRRNFDTSKMR